MFKHILLPTDGSKLSGKAVKQGLQLATSLGARVTVFNVMPEGQIIIDEGYATPTTLNLQERLEKEGQKRSKKIVDAAKAEAAAAGVACEGISVKSGSPYEAIIKQCKKSKCDLIMMASHGRTGLSSILLGSETAKVLTHSSVPVLVVR